VKKQREQGRKVRLKKKEKKQRGTLVEKKKQYSE